MAINNPFEITYGTRAVGGTSDDYLLNGPYATDHSFGAFRLVFEVVVISTSYATLQSLSEALEDDFRKRDQDLVISLDGDAWTYTSGSNILNVTASIAKSGDTETDRGFSRAYACTIEGTLPVDDESAAAGNVTGLKDITWSVVYEPGRQRIVTATGSYSATAAPARLATANYTNTDGADKEASTFLEALDSTATFELTQENYDPDRNDHELTFTRQYVELLANQTAASLDSASIRDHQVRFTQLSNHPGDSVPGIYRLRRVAASYDCYVDIIIGDGTGDANLIAVFDNLLKGHILELFRTNFQPQVFCIEDRRVTYDETSKRINVLIQFLYQPGEGEPVVEVNSSLTTRELRTVDYTPMHRQSEFAMIRDVGWATRERISSRVVMVLGAEPPKRRIGEDVTPEGSGSNAEAFPAMLPAEGHGGGSGGGTAGGTGGGSGFFGQPGIGTAGQGIGGVVPGGGDDNWTVTSNTSQVSHRWIGDPDEEQIQVSVLNETVVEQYHKIVQLP